jgi:hypothetical protein
MSFVFVHGQQDNGQVRMAFQDLFGHFQSVETGHVQVQDGYVHRLALQSPQGCQPVGCLRSHGQMIHTFYHLPQTFQKYGVIIGDE